MAGNTTPISGHVCRCTVDGTNSVEYTNGWTLNIVVATHDVSRQGQNYSEHIQGQVSGNGTISGRTVLNSAGYQYIDIFNVLHGASPDCTPAADSKFYLEDTGDYYEIAILLTGLTINSQLGSEVNWTANYITTGQIDLTVA